jgi:uncharacterized membrane protein YdbT with pleckstrin-like domain
MKYVDKNLIKDEVVTYRAGLHWIAVFWPAVIGALLGLAGISTTLAALFSSDKDSGLMLGLGTGYIIVAAILLGLGVLRMRSAEFAVTNKRVILKYGLIRTRTVEMFLQKIESIGINQNLVGRNLVMWLMPAAATVILASRVKGEKLALVGLGYR